MPTSRKPPKESAQSTEAPSTATTTVSSSKSRAKRKKFSKHDDLVLLRQVSADQPFASVRGSLMDAWTSLANKVKAVQGFSKQEITGKSAQARFNAAASGVSEDYTESQQLLDEIVLAVDEHAREEAQRALELKEKLESEDNVGKLMREEAVSRLKKRKDRGEESESEKPSPRKVTIYDLMREDNEKERQMRAEQFQQKQELQRKQKEMELQDRKEEREFKLRLARLEIERYENLLKLALLKARGGAALDGVVGKVGDVGEDAGVGVSDSVLGLGGGA
ncbi:hypothetical protein GN958_ATG23763 [Phytophthora infestans]|uniref:Uncharacterized protein n=1 Tax=Phytophthora infestans TaxID=4787 RepID=A0A8S9TGI1_PHYIN|nr:hypothetical protein GN958_ATG23763 [Phytophthora infestans]